MAKPLSPLKVAAPVAPVTPAVASPTPETQAGPKKIRVHSKTGGLFINPFTHEEIGSEPTFATQDSWLDSQIAANKIEKA
jgi:hypothetical protein